MEKNDFFDKAGESAFKNSGFEQVFDSHVKIVLLKSVENRVEGRRVVKKTSNVLWKTYFNGFSPIKKGLPSNQPSDF